MTQMGQGSTLRRSKNLRSQSGDRSRNEIETAMKHNEPDVDITPALEAVAVPSAVIGRDGRIRWLNRGATAIIGDRVGEPFARAIALEDHHVARTNFDMKLAGESASTEYSVTLLARGGRRLPVNVSSVPFWERGEITGVFGVAYPAGAEGGGAPRSNGSAATPELTTRQFEALSLLAEGLGTRVIATRLGIAEETARNHIRGILTQLGAHSRLEAVVRAYRLGLLQPSRDS
jgi:DNA-binding CsgD family transcriptional regulator